MTTPEQIKFAHTPTGPEVIAGVTLKDAKRASKWPAYVDVAQSVTGLILGIFLFCHMAFTSSIQVGKDLFWNLIQISGGTPIFGHEQVWLHFVFVGFITLCVIIHALCALRRFPTSYKQFRDIRAHVTVVHHADTTLWFFQFVTAIILTGMVFPHVMGMLTAPSQIDPNLSSVHTYHNGLIWTFIFLVATEIHGMIGLYRLGVKWDVIKGRAHGFRKTMVVIAFLMICFDPLDGSSNIDINVSIGTIFSVLPNPRADASAPEDKDFLQPGQRQLAAGYVIYGPQTQMVFTLGRGVVMFTLDPRSDRYILTTSNVQVPEAAKEFAINCSNMRHWEGPVKRYVAELLEGTTGVRGKDFNMRWVAAMVAEVHRILCRGGIFMYPRDDRDPSRPGKLRLMYEANPMSWLMEQAGGRATNGHERILGIKPEKLHQRVAVFLGAKEEVERVTDYHAKNLTL